jgi:RNA polymerase sigma-70 factor (ECF subfamily)
MARPAAHRDTSGGTAELDHWLEAFEAELDFVYRTLRNFGAGRADVEDMVQEVFLAMWRRRERYDPARPLRPWIAGIAFRVVQEHRRRRGRAELPIGLPDLLDEVPGQEEQLERAQARRLVHGALSRLPEKQRVAVVMHELEGLSVREIAEALALPLFTVYSQLKRGLRAFTKEIRRGEVMTSLPPALRALTPQALLARGGARDHGAPRKRNLRRRLLFLLPEPTLEPRGAPASDPGPGGLSGAVGWRLLLAALAAAVVAAGLTAGRFTRLSDGPVTQEQAIVRSTMLVPAPPRTAPPAAPPRQAVETAPDLALPSPPPTRGLVGYWRFDEATGSEASDRSAAGNHCSLHNLDPQGAWGAGVFGAALALTGRGWLECPVTGPLAGIDQQMTIGLWVARGGNLQHYKSLVSRQLDWGRLDEFMFGFADGELVFASHAWRGRVVRPLPAGVGRWIHVAVTRDSDGTTILYVDGKQIGRGFTQPAPLPPGGNPLIIGAAVNGEDPQRTEFRFEGAIDELVIYDRALSPREVDGLARRHPSPP